MKILNIVETAYRATLEEQDDTILWLSHALKNAGADITLLLRANAVNYAVKGQNAGGLTFGSLQQEHPPQLDKDLEAMSEKGVPVYLVEEDMLARGLSDGNLITGITKINLESLPAFIDQYDQIWHW